MRAPVIRLSFCELINKLSVSDAAAIVRYVLDKNPGRKPKETLKKYIRYKRTKKAILFTLRFSKIGMVDLYIYRCKVGLRRARSLLKSMSIETIDFTSLTNNYLKQNVRYLYYLTEKMATIKPPISCEGSLFSTGENIYIISSPSLSRKIDTILAGNNGATRLTIAPYIINRLIKHMNMKITSIIYSLDPQITGVRGVDIIEVRGTDVISGLASLIARLDRFRKITSLFGPIIEVTFGDALTINRSGRFSAKNIGLVIKLISLFEQISASPM